MRLVFTPLGAWHPPNDLETSLIGWVMMICMVADNHGFPPDSIQLRFPGMYAARDSISGLTS